MACYFYCFSLLSKLAFIHRSSPSNWRNHGVFLPFGVSSPFTLSCSIIALHRSASDRQTYSTPRNDFQLEKTTNAQINEISRISGWMLFLHSFWRTYNHSMNLLREGRGQRILRAEGHLYGMKSDRHQAWSIGWTNNVLIITDSPRLLFSVEAPSWKLLLLLIVSVSESITIWYFYVSWTKFRISNIDWTRNCLESRHDVES
jgi:hypothetical protein